MYFCNRNTMCDPIISIGHLRQTRKSTASYVRKMPIRTVHVVCKTKLLMSLALCPCILYFEEVRYTKLICIMVGRIWESNTLWYLYVCWSHVSLCMTEGLRHSQAYKCTLIWGMGYVCLHVQSFLVLMRVYTHHLYRKFYLYNNVIYILCCTHRNLYETVLQRSCNLYIVVLIETYTKQFYADIKHKKIDRSQIHWHRSMHSVKRLI